MRYALALLGSAPYLKVFAPEQLQALALFSLKSHAAGYGFGLVFFGFACIILGYLMFKSGYFPKLLGIGLTIAGASYLTGSFARILAPDYANTILLPALIAPFIAEVSLCLWLIIKGVNVEQWEKRVHESA